MEQLCLHDSLVEVGDDDQHATHFCITKKFQKHPAAILMLQWKTQLWNSHKLYRILTWESNSVGMTINEIKISEWKPKKGDVWHYMAS
jgi:hypothetical protein